MKNQPLSACEFNWIVKLQPEVKRKRVILNDWEKAFCDDLFNRFETFKENLNLSTKQWEIIHKITDKVIK